MNEIQVLIIEDDEALCFLLSKVLMLRNIKLRYVHSLSEAKVILEYIKPSVIVLDHRFPDGEGLDFIPYIKNKHPLACILFTSAWDDKGLETDVLSKGATSFISKPYELSEITLELERSLKSAQTL